MDIRLTGPEACASFDNQRRSLRVRRAVFYGMLQRIKDVAASFTPSLGQLKEDAHRREHTEFRVSETSALGAFTDSLRYNA